MRPPPTIRGWGKQRLPPSFLPPPLPRSSVCTRLAMHFDNDVWQAGGQATQSHFAGNGENTDERRDAQYSTT